MPFVWEENINHLLNLREALINSAILNFPNSAGMYILDSDASSSTIGATLSMGKKSN
jgi:hypothetical protein